MALALCSSFSLQSLFMWDRFWDKFRALESTSFPGKSLSQKFEAGKNSTEGY